MKIIKAIFMILLILIPSVKINANLKYESFDIANTSNEQYIFNFDCITSYQFTYNIESTTNNMKYSGKKLENFLIMANAKYNGKHVDGEINWDDKDYIINDGDQLVTATFKDLTNDKNVKIKVYINGNDELKRIVKGGNNGGIVLYSYNTNPFDNVQDMEFTNINGDKVVGDISYFSNSSTMKSGYNNITWIFTPNENKYETKSGYIRIYKPVISTRIYSVLVS